MVDQWISIVSDFEIVKKIIENSFQVMGWFPNLQAMAQWLNIE